MNKKIIFDNPSIIEIKHADRSVNNKYIIKCITCGRVYTAGHSTAIRIQKGLKKDCNKCSDRSKHGLIESRHPELVKAAKEMDFVNQHWRVPKI